MHATNPRMAGLFGKIAEVGARVGYTARGAVYLSVGAIALLASLRLTPHAAGAMDALRAWSQWPPGIVLLWLTGLGLYAFAGWRALQSVFDIENLGRSPHAVVTRAGKAVSGLMYGALAVSVFGLIDTLEDLHEPDEHATTVASVERMLTWPMGSWLVIGLGALIFATGLGNMIRAVFSHFSRDLDCEPYMVTWAGSFARAGYFARGVAFLPAGVFTVLAGVHARASEARGVGDALDTMKSQPFGHVGLGLVALGLMAFGIFGLLKARFRRIGG